jgi:hypothetical protein
MSRALFAAALCTVDNIFFEFERRYLLHSKVEQNEWLLVVSDLNKLWQCRMGYSHFAERFAARAERDSWADLFGEVRVQLEGKHYEVYSQHANIAIKFTIKGEALLCVAEPSDVHFSKMVFDLLVQFQARAARGTQHQQHAASCVLVFVWKICVAHALQRKRICSTRTNAMQCQSFVLRCSQTRMRMRSTHSKLTMKSCRIVLLRHIV